jgi:hypothetical protein
MSFRAHFDCLWCGQPWTVRGADDLEGWAGLCPACLGKADDNGFLRGRVRSALRARAAAADSGAIPGAASPGGDWEDWYLRRAPYARGPIHDGPWSMELDEVTRWVDGQLPAGLIVQLGAGMGWWSGLLAEHGELWVYDDDEASLEATRSRLLAHGLRAHLHSRDPLAPPDKAADAVFSAYLLSGAATAAELDRRLDLVRGWLGQGGRFIFVEQAGSGPVDGPGGSLRPLDPAVLGRHLVGRAFEAPRFGPRRSAFLVGGAQAPAVAISPPGTGPAVSGSGPR